MAAPAPVGEVPTLGWKLHTQQVGTRSTATTTATIREVFRLKIMPDNVAPISVRAGGTTTLKPREPYPPLRCLRRTTPSQWARCTRELSWLRGALETASHLLRSPVPGTELSGGVSSTCCFVRGAGTWRRARYRGHEGRQRTQAFGRVEIGGTSKCFPFVLSRNGKRDKILRDNRKGQRRGLPASVCTRWLIVSDIMSIRHLSVIGSLKL